jgi:arylsulfatase A-like enzyme
MTQPNILFIFADQWRAQAFSHKGDPNVKTPNLDKFAQENTHFENAISGCPVCCPYRASLMTGVYPNKHGMMTNDLCLAEMYEGPYLAECLNKGGYQTAYIGKWHIDGKGRQSYVAPERRLGFEWWKGFECTHDYNYSPYYTEDDPKPHIWDGYDADIQTDELIRFMKEDTGDNPFAMFLSWGPPHNPYETAPEEFQALYNESDIVLRDNVPAEKAEESKKQLAGYYAHCSALDAAFGRILESLKETGLDKNTIVIFTSDHGDMIGSQNQVRKQKPWTESIHVPFYVRHPDIKGNKVNRIPIDAPDLMPTILGLCDLPVPSECQGVDLSKNIIEDAESPIKEGFIYNYVIAGEWAYKAGGIEYRGLIDERYTYARTLKGPWLLFDNIDDPFQMNNLIDNSEYENLKNTFDQSLSERLNQVGDNFISTEEMIKEKGWDCYPNGVIAMQHPQEPLPEPYGN